MIINGPHLVGAAPIHNMLDRKVEATPTSYGLTEAGYDIRIEEEVFLSPDNRFAMASTHEYFDMPGTMIAVVHDKSSWARRGLSVFNTVLEPGWRGYLTLELAYHGMEELYIPAGCGIAQCIFHGISSWASYNGRYQDQGPGPTESRTYK